MPIGRSRPQHATDHSRGSENASPMVCGGICLVRFDTSLLRRRFTSSWPNFLNLILVTLATSIERGCQGLRRLASSPHLDCALNRSLTRTMTASSPTRVPQGRLKTVGYRCGRATRPLTSTWVLFAGALQRKPVICDSVLECSVCGVPCFRGMLVLLLLDANSSPSERWRRTLLGASLERCLLQNSIPVHRRRQWSHWGCT
ncbi:hypothetical protein C8R46DRAFT_1120458 [Mycena filopes]|nr:hypothetical protein C8R46DRAFT_1120458 [Mycena filopes]